MVFSLSATRRYEEYLKQEQLPNKNYFSSSACMAKDSLRQRH